MDRSIRRAWSYYLIAGLVVLLLAGCTLGPSRIRSDWRQYNESVTKISDEEMLLNLVRMRYNDSPGFLPVASVTAQRSWSRSGQVSAAIPEGGPDTLSVGGTTLASERPTVSFVPGGEEFVEALVSPLTLETVFLFSYIGWPTSQTWPLMVKSMNGVQYLPKSGAPVEVGFSDYGEFLELAWNLKQLQEDSLIEIGRIEKLVPIEPLVQAESVRPEEVRAAIEAGYIYSRNKNSDKLTLNKRRQVTVLRFAPEANGTAEHDAIIRILQLDPTTNVYEFESALEGFLKEVDEKNTKIEIGLRSVVEMMHLLSKGVEVPECHARTNLAPSFDGGINWHEVLGGFHIHCCEKRPSCASIAIKHRDYWFYIDDRDQISKAKFLLLRAIFDSQVQGGGAENLPVLTLPL